MVACVHDIRSPRIDHRVDAFVEKKNNYVRIVWNRRHIKKKKLRISEAE